MADLGPRRIVNGPPPSEPPAPRRRGPGVAVLAVAAYSVLFGAALWIFKRESPLFSRPAALRDRAAGSGAAAPGRAVLLSGGDLAVPARGAYLARLEADRCDCGCELTLRACLMTDHACARSPELARRRLSAASAPTGARAAGRVR